MFTLYSSGGIDSYDEKYYPEMTEMKKNDRLSLSVLYHGVFLPKTSVDVVLSRCKEVLLVH